MISPRARRAAVLLAVVLAGPALAGCSFHGSVSAAQSSTPATTGRSATTAGTTAATTGSTGPAGSTSSTSGSRSTATAGGGPGTVDRCHTSELTGSLVPGSPGAGQRYATLVLRDTGGQRCTIHGYGGLGLVGADGHALPTTQVRAPSPAPATVLLAPGGTVSSQLHWSVVPGPGDSQSSACQPTPTTLRVIPPDETDALSVRWDQGPVCSKGTIEQRAYAG
ncbi:MAG TPA: DUF4232 domain-containing protein [Blastococcus sp.]|jgi:hypothetical protein|nr:DUF4232 domain-containing protein [Blastococcus sp.]